MDCKALKNEQEKNKKKKTRSINPFKEYLKLIVKDIEAYSFFGHWSVRFFGTWDLFGFHDLLNKGLWLPIFSNMTSILPNPDLYVSQFNIPLRIWALSNYGLKSLFIYKLISQVFPLDQVGIEPYISQVHIAESLVFFIHAMSGSKTIFGC